MSLMSWCPQCFAPVARAAVGFGCDDHGVVAPLWRAPQVDYGAFAEVISLAGGLPTYLPWPLSPGWTVTDVACVADPAREDAAGLATVTTTAGASAFDGDVAVTVVIEEPGVGLGARIAGTGELDPGSAFGSGTPAVRVRTGQWTVPLWPVPSGDSDDVLARAVFAGESGGRWLWLVMTPASSALLLRDEWLFADAGGFGPEAVEVPFGGPAPPW